VSTNASGRHSEVRTSSRSVRKVSYVESDGSEEIDEGKKKKLHKEETEALGGYSFTYVKFSLYNNEIEINKLH
jgi:chromodomain-helicase-DNA-binding protein 1